jgi:uncharacterized membrane protein YbaN (DUF454 family)
VHVTTTGPQRRVVRGVYLALGVVCVGVAVAGIVLPLIPITFPTLLAAYFFARSSPRFDNWLTSHRIFGPIVRDWRAGAGFTVRAKAIATGSIVASFLFTGIVVIHDTAVRLIWALLAVALCTYVLTRPTKPAAG